MLSKTPEMIGKRTENRAWENIVKEWEKKTEAEKSSHTNGFPVSPTRFDNTLITLLPSAIILKFRGFRGYR